MIFSSELKKIIHIFIVMGTLNMEHRTHNSSNWFKLRNRLIHFSRKSFYNLHVFQVLDDFVMGMHLWHFEIQLEIEYVESVMKSNYATQIESNVKRKTKTKWKERNKTLKINNYRKKERKSFQFSTINKTTNIFNNNYFFFFFNIRRKKNNEKKSHRWKRIMNSNQNQIKFNGSTK